jgi:hypothetical protein
LQAIYRQWNENLLNAGIPGTFTEIPWLLPWRGDKGISLAKSQVDNGTPSAPRCTAGQSQTDIVALGQILSEMYLISW